MVAFLQSTGDPLCALGLLVDLEQSYCPLAQVFFSSHHPVHFASSQSCTQGYSTILQ